MTAKIDYYYLGSLSRTYIIQGMLDLEDSKTQSTTAVNFPKNPSSTTLLNSLFGQKAEMNINIILLPRSDNYTNSTYAYSTGSPDEQRLFLRDQIFQGTGYHKITDESGNVYTGRIASMRTKKMGDEPVIYTCTIQFMEGINTTP